MKKFIIAFAALLVTAVQASAMSYQQARDQALFLTDKMAYELNLTDEQYEAAYEINLDYLMGVNTYDDLYGSYWEQRNLDLSYILYRWQYDAYCAASYFYRPLYWDGGFWHFAIYARYPHRDYFFFGRPAFYISYHGGHSWYRNGGRSWYYDHRPAPPREGDRHFGMRDDFERGNYGNGVRFNSNNRSFGNARANSNNRSFGNARANSNSRTFGNARANSNSRSFGNARVNGNRSFSNSNSTNSRSISSTRVNSNRSFGNGRTSSVNNSQVNRQRSFGSERKSSTRTTVTRPSTIRRSFSSSRSSMPSRTFSPSSSSQRSSSTARSFSSSRSNSRSFGSSASSRSFSKSAPATRSSVSKSSSASRSSGGHFGSRR